MTAEEKKTIAERFTKRYSDEYGRIYTSNESNTLLCELLQPYTPMDDFMKLLKQQMTVIDMYGCDKLILDQRATRGFHQPTMEWHYLTWKVEAYKKYGLTKHRLIFTDELWFRKCIEAAREEIRVKDPGSIVHTLDIKICDTLKDAIDS